MARGWESKSVEAQIETRERAGKDSAAERLDPQQLDLLRKREGLRLSRARVLSDLETARNPRYRKILQEALNYLDSELARQ
jgi:hypothetical protein